MPPHWSHVFSPNPTSDPSTNSFLFSFKIYLNPITRRCPRCSHPTRSHCHFYPQPAAAACAPHGPHPTPQRAFENPGRRTLLCRASPADRFLSTEAKETRSARKDAPWCYSPHSWGSWGAGGRPGRKTPSSRVRMWPTGRTRSGVGWEGGPPRSAVWRCGTSRKEAKKGAE